MKVFPNRIFKKHFSCLLIILILFHAVGCRYFMIESVTKDNIASISQIGEIHKYFIVHAGHYTYSLSGISVDSTSIYGLLAPVSKRFYYTEDRGNRYTKTEQNIINEVHIYLNEYARPQLGLVEIPLTIVTEIKIIEKDSRKTTASYVGGTFAIIGGALAIITIIVALTKSSCPYIYSYDGEGFVFEGEVFGGAIAKNLARDDYLPLPLIKENNGHYRIRICNELKERQYTDLIQLVVVDHLADQKVLLDKYGKPHLVIDAGNLINAASYSGEYLNSALEHRDTDVFFFNDPNYSKNGVIIKFKKPINIEKGKLILNTKNTLWFDYLFGEFLSKFGEFYDTWMNKQEKLTAPDRTQKIIDNDFPLTVFIKKHDGWHMIDYLFTTGPLAYRDMIIPIELSEIKGDVVEIKVETGFMFWELNYAAMDYSTDTGFHVSYLKPSLAIGTGSHDWTSELEETDSCYMEQEKVGELTEIIFKTKPPPENQIQSVFLHSNGYYELIREFHGLPQISELNKFKVPGYFSDFSRDEYLRVLYVDEALARVDTIQ